MFNLKLHISAKRCITILLLICFTSALLAGCDSRVNTEFTSETTETENIESTSSTISNMDIQESTGGLVDADPTTNNSTDHTESTAPVEEEPDDANEDQTTPSQPSDEDEQQKEPALEEDHDVDDNSNTEPPVETKPEPTEPEPTEPPKNDQPQKDPPSTVPENRDDYVGRFKIPSVGVNVACYSSAAQSIVDDVDSAAYFYASGHVIIADHRHQGFNAIKSCVKGTSARIETPTGTRYYTCVGKINGHNTGTTLTDANGNSINNLYPGAIVAYTCNENWQNVTIVFFSDGSTEYDDHGNPITEPVYGCGEGHHTWGAWEVAWEVCDSSGKYYGWDKRVCKLCCEEEWVPRKEPSENFEMPEQETNPEETIPEDTTPEETIPEETTPTEPESPPPTEPIPDETEHEPTEPSLSDDENNSTGIDTEGADNGENQSNIDKEEDAVEPSAEPDINN